jgi:hypothetical protein
MLENRNASRGDMLVQYHHIISEFALANEEPRGAWRILMNSGFCGGNAKAPPLRGGSFGVSKTDSQKLRSLLYKVRMYFESNPDD